MSANKVVAVTLVARTSAYIAQMRAASMNTAAFGVSAGAAGASAAAMAPGMKKATRGFNQAAAGAGLMQAKFLGPAGVLMALKSVGQAAIRFEDEFAMVRKTMQESDAVLDQVALTIRRIATELPVTTTELNQIATVAGQLGIAGEDVADFTETVAKLSMATNLTAEGAAIDFARLSNVMGKPIGEVEELGNVVVHLGNNMAAQETEIMEFAKRIAGVGTQMGMTEDEILALSAALPALGLRAEMGGTAITRIMVEMQAAVTDGTEKLGVFADVAGQSADEFAANWRDDPAAALLTFTEGVAGLSDSGVDAFETVSDLDLSMVRTQDTLLRLAGGTDVYRQAQGLANEEMEQQQALQTEVAKRMDTTASRAKVLRGRFKDLALDMGNGMLPAVDAGIQGLNKIADGLDATGEAADASRENFEAWADAGIGRSEATARTWVDFVSGGTVGATDDMKQALVDAALAQYELDRRQQGNAATTERMTGLAEAYADGTRDATGATGAFSDAAGTAAAETKTAADALEQYLDALQRATDPVFNLIDAIQRVDDANQNYVDTLADEEATQRDVESAAIDLARELANLEGAAIDGDLSFQEFESKLAEWNAMGALTAEQANAIRDRVAEARGEAEEFQGNYQVNVNAGGNAWQRIAALRSQIRNLPSSNVVVEAMVGGFQERAAGGPVSAGQTYLVGEEGPELFTAQTSGTIIPAGQTSTMLAGTSTSSGGSHVTVVQLDGRAIARSEAFQDEHGRWQTKQSRLTAGAM